MEPEWEEEALVTKDAWSESKIVAKYGGLKFYDPDAKAEGLNPWQVYVIDDSEVQYNNKKGEKQHYVLVHPFGWSDLSEYTPFQINDCLHTGIRLYYKKNPGECVHMCCVLGQQLCDCYCLL